MSKLNNVTILNDGNPMPVNSEEGYIFTVSPSTAKKGTGYRTDKPVSLTQYELKMPGVVVCQNRGMIFSSCRPINGEYIIPTLDKLNLIIVDEKSRKLIPTDDPENKIVWKGNGPHEVKDVAADGAGIHYFNTANGSMAFDLWFKIAKYGYGIKGMIMPGLATDIGKTVVDHWGIARVITRGNTMLLNSSLVKGLGAYNSLEELVAHSEEWGLTTLMKQWQSGDHEVANKRILGTQINSTNFTLERSEIRELLKPEARKIWAMQFPEIAWRKMASINTSRGRAFAARPDLVYKDLVMRQIDNRAGNDFLRNAQGKTMVAASYLKMYPDRLAYSLCYVDGMDINEAAKKAASCGIHGEIRVSPSYAGRKVKHNEDGTTTIAFKKETLLDSKGRYIEVALVRYPHGAPSETIIVKAYLDDTVPADVIMFPFPVANDDGTIPVKYLYAMRLQGADYDGDAVTAFTEKIWLEAQKRNAGKSYMIIPVNTESTEKDKTLVTDETFEAFCQTKIESLSNRVGLIATSLKYYLSQAAESIRMGSNPEVIEQMIVDHACAMGDDIDEFKHGKANNEIDLFTIHHDGEKDETLFSPYFNRYSCKFRSEEDMHKTIFTKTGKEKKAGSGVLDMFATEWEKLMAEAGLQIVSDTTEVSDGSKRFYFTVHPVKWSSKYVDLYTSDKGIGQIAVALPEELEKAYKLEANTKLTAKDLFRVLYRDHSASCKDLVGCNDDRDMRFKALAKIDARYALAKVAIVAWTQRMWKQKSSEDLTAEDAMVMFTTLMTQHTERSRSTIESETRYGVFKREDDTEYKIDVFSAQRKYNYFLDVCGDGLLLAKTEEPDFPDVSDKIIEAAEAKAPDLELAKAKATKELDLIGELVTMLNNDGIERVVEEINNELVPLRDDEDEDYIPDEV